MFGLIFSLFHVDLNEKVSDNGSSGIHRPPTQDVTFANQECILYFSVTKVEFDRRK
jgi:hypothetical protein